MHEIKGGRFSFDFFQAKTKEEKHLCVDDSDP
jgi:hypothetical protein